MYISIFGNAIDATQFSHSTVLKEKTILDVEKAYEEYGGYSVGASFVSSHGNKIFKPTLISREFANYYANVELMAEIV